MKVIVNRVQSTVSFDKFADAHGLTMVVNERPANLVTSGVPLWWAWFENAEISDGWFLWGVVGNGSTIEEAIDAYTERLRGQLLVIDAHSPSRREIQCPKEWGK